MSKLSRAIKFIFAIWVTAFLLALPQAMQFSVEPENGGTACTMNNYLFKHVFVISGFIFFGGPMTAICVLYVLIGVKLKRSRLLQAVPRRCYDVHRGISAQSRVIRMLVAVAVAFFLCWAPFHTQRLMAVYGSIDSKIFNDIFYILNYTSGVLYFLSTCINPLLYNIMSHKFREAFKVTLARHFGLVSTKSQSQSHNYCALMRQNGSMRLHTMVNNNNNNLSSYRLPLHNYREQNHHLSLQDSLRTTMTTTTTSGGTTLSSGSNSCRSSIQRNRCLSTGSQSTLNTSLNKSDINTSGRINANGAIDTLPHRKLQKQISELSSLGDELLEAEGASIHHHQGQQHTNINRKNDLRRSLIINNAKNLRNSLDSTHWNSEGLNLEQRGTEEDTDLFPKPVAPLAPLIARQQLCLTPVNSVAELHQNPRSRLKLTRIISRRNRDMCEVQASPRVELMRAQLPGMGLKDYAVNTNAHQHRPKLRHINASDVKSKTKNKSAIGLVERFRWRTHPKMEVKHEDGALIVTPTGTSTANITNGNEVSKVV